MSPSYWSGIRGRTWGCRWCSAGCGSWVKLSGEYMGSLCPSMCTFEIFHNLKFLKLLLFIVIKMNVILTHFWGCSLTVSSHSLQWSVTHFYSFLQISIIFLIIFLKIDWTIWSSWGLWGFLFLFFLSEKEKTKKVCLLAVFLFQLDPWKSAEKPGVFYFPHTSILVMSSFLWKSVH